MIARTLFENEHEQFRDSVRKFLTQHAAPYHSQWEKDGQIDRQLWNKAGEMGLLCPTMPEQFGGPGVDYRYNVIVNEEITKQGLSGLGFIVHSDITVPYINNNGSNALKKKYIPGCVTGELVGAIAMTEPGAGSDLQGIKTTAVLDGDEYVINGSKTFITNGQHADIVVVVCVTDPKAGAAGISLIVVEATTPGFERGQNLEKIGLKAQDTSELFFNDVRVPKENVIGKLGAGFKYLMNELPQERLGLAVAALMSCETAMQQTIDYVKERKAFGKPVAVFQNTQFKLAELSAEITLSLIHISEPTRPY